MSVTSGPATPQKRGSARTRGVAAGRSVQRACERSSDWRRGAAGSPDPHASERRTLVILVKGGVELGGGDVGWQAAALQVTHGDDEGVFLEHLVDGGGFAQVALAGAGALGGGNARYFGEHGAQAGLRRLDVAAERDPR